MSEVTPAFRTLSVILIGSVIGCSSAQGGAQPDEGPFPPEDGIVLVIRNDIQSTVDCNLEVAGRPNRPLGTLRTNSTETFDVPTSQIATGFRVLCRRQSAVAARSRQINVRTRARITFTLSTEMVQTQTFP